LSSDFHSGIDNARDAAGIHPSIIVEDKSSVRRRVVRDNGEKGPAAVEKNSCGGGERTETISYTVRRTKGGLAVGRTAEKWHRMDPRSPVIDRFPLAE